MIVKPQLPPKKGYVEVINENGEHIYKATPEQAKIDNLKERLQNIDVACIPETGEDEIVDTNEIIMNKLDYLTDVLNSILELM